MSKVVLPVCSIVRLLILSTSQILTTTSGWRTRNRLHIGIARHDTNRQTAIHGRVGQHSVDLGQGLRIEQVSWDRLDRDSLGFGIRLGPHGVRLAEQGPDPLDRAWGAGDDRQGRSRSIVPALWDPVFVSAFCLPWMNDPGSAREFLLGCQSARPSGRAVWSEMRLELRLNHLNAKESSANDGRAGQ